MTEIEEINMMLRNNEPLITWRNSHIEVLLRKIKELEDAVNKHEQFKRTHDKVVSLEDEELYGTINEIHP